MRPLEHQAYCARLATVPMADDQDAVYIAEYSLTYQRYSVAVGVPAGNQVNRPVEVCSDLLATEPRCRTANPDPGPPRSGAELPRRSSSAPDRHQGRPRSTCSRMRQPSQGGQRRRTPSPRCRPNPFTHRLIDIDRHRNVLWLAKVHVGDKRVLRREVLVGAGRRHSCASCDGAYGQIRIW